MHAGGQLAAIAVAEPDNDAQRNLRDNAVRLRERLEALAPEVRTRLGAYLAQRCFLVVVSTPDRDSAYRIFSVLNDRGLDLTAADILKATTIGKLQAEPAAEAEYTEKWENAEEALGRDQFLELFGHIRTIHQKVKRKEALLDEVQKYVRPSKRPRDFIDGELVPYTEVFRVVRGASFGEAGSEDPAVKSVNRTLRWLGRVDNADWVPVAMVLVRHFATDRARLATALRRLERLASAMMVYRANVNDRAVRYAAVLEHLEGEHAKGEPPAWTGDPLAAGSPLDLQPDEHARVLDALDGDVYGVTRTRTFILLRLNDALSDGSATYDLRPTVEHVLPQNPKPGTGWDEAFPDIETREAYVHKLGNLVLLSRQRNSAAGRLPFGEKKTSYFGTGSSSAYVLTAKVLNEPEWTPDVVEARQSEMLGALARAWDLDLDRWRSGAESGTGTLGTSVLDYLARSDAHTQSIFARLDEQIKGLGSVERVDTKTYLGFRRTDHDTPYFATAKVQPATSTVVVYVDLDPAAVDLRDGFTRDVTKKGHNGRGDLEVRVRSDDDLREAAPLLRRAYETASPNGRA